MESHFAGQIADFERVLLASKTILEKHNNDIDPMWAPLARLVKAFDALYQQSKSQGVDIKNLEELKQDLIDELEVLSEIDGLTGLWNQRHFSRGLDHEIRRASRSQRPLSIMLIEIDYFPEFEKNYGQSSGELCLKRVGGQLSRVVNRPYDIIARSGSEQFVCLLPETNNAGGMIVAQGVFSGIADLDILHESSEVADIITVSLGLLTRIPERGERPEDISGSAEALLQEARDAGRNRIVSVDRTPPEEQKLK